MLLLIYIDDTFSKSVGFEIACEELKIEELKEIKASPSRYHGFENMNITSASNYTSEGIHVNCKRYYFGDV